MRLKKKNVIMIALVSTGLVLSAYFAFNARQNGNLKNEAAQTAPENEKKDIVQGNITAPKTIDYSHLKKDTAITKLMIARKDSLGIKKSLDMIVRSDESIKIGDVRISMRDILEKAFTKEGDVFEEKIDPAGAVLPQHVKEYGIYVVQPGDNIWNIHFNVLKEYYENQGVLVSPTADEPIETGMSSGVGKILKFSEKLVIIYNLNENKIDMDIDLLEPLSKIIVYNMNEVFSLLQELNYKDIDRIQFDGETIWIPTKQS